MSNFIKVGVVDVGIDIPDLSRSPRTNISYHREVEDKVLRFSIDQDELECDDVDMPHQFKDLILDIMRMVNGVRLGRCIITNLKPGCMVYPHKDHENYANYYDRFHVPLVTNDKSLFRCGNETIAMKAGEVWWFDALEEHECWNDGDTDRVHLIMDFRL